MQMATGPQWSIRLELSWEAQFVLWLRRRSVPASGLAESQWMEWMDRVVSASEPPPPDVLVATVPSEDLRAVCDPLWPQFLHEWEPAKRRALEERIDALTADRRIALRIREIMGDSDEERTFVHTDEPGTMCRPVGRAWILGDAYLEPSAFCTLLAQLRQ